VKKSERLACALTIGGLDPGGGAGIVADTRAFAVAGVFGCAAVAVITAQSTSGLRATQAVAARDVLAQSREVLRHQHVRAIKTGALGSERNVRAVGELLAVHRGLPVVVDPVMAPTRGRGRLLAERAVGAMRTHLIPRATLVTANAPEAGVLTGARVTNVSEAHDAALALCRMGAHAALVKGGHLAGANAVDVLAIGGDAIELRARRMRLPAIHGGGCTLAALIAGHMAADAREWSDAPDEVLLDAVRWAKRTHQRMLGKVRDVGGDMRVLVP
jgi:hydroxymethylpyrimidine kinase/phosphomethylpyrimidine kinase